MRRIALVMELLFSMSCVAATTAPTSSPATASVAPVEAARQFAVAFSNPTREGLRAVLAGRTPMEEQAVELWSEAMAAQFRLQETVRQSFGGEGYAVVFGRSPRPRPNADEMARQLDQMFDGAKTEIGQVEARVTVAAGTSSEQMWLIKTPAGWKMWIGAVLQARSPELIEYFVRYNGGYGRVRNQVADEIVAGRIANARAAREALNRLEDEEAARSDPATTRISTPEQGKAELREKLQKMQEIEADRDRLEREAATRPVQ